MLAHPAWSGASASLPPRRRAAAARLARARKDRGGGVRLTQGIHTLDLLLSFAGDPAEVKAFSSTTPVHRMETEDLVCAAVRWKSGALGVVQATTCAYSGYAERIELVGVNGTAQLEGTALRMPLQDGTRPARLASRGAGGLPGRRAREPSAPGERGGGVEGAPVYRCTAAGTATSLSARRRATGRSRS